MRNRNKKLILIAIVIAVFSLIFIPTKLAVGYDKLNTKDNYIICKRVRTTGFDWEIIGGSRNYYSKNEYVEIINDLPAKEYSYSILHGQNEYLFYGEFIGQDSFYGEKYRKFKVIKWNIIVPVRRYSIRKFFAPKTYLTILDFID
jgi:hypothetical protein